MSLIEVEDLRKTFAVAVRREGRFGAIKTLLAREYQQLSAVDGISFRVEAGEMIGYIGPNGAGKSTTIKMLTGILVPSSGQIAVDGRVPHQQRVDHVRRIGVVFGQRTQLWWDLPTIESFELLRHIYRIPEARWRSNLREFVELLDLGRFWKRRCASFRWASACAPIWWRRCCTSRRSCSWMSRRSAWMWWRRSASASFWPTSTASAA